MPRDPRVYPREGDVLYQANGSRELHIDKATRTEVAYRVTDGRGGLCGAYRTPLVNWRLSAPYTCERTREVGAEAYEETRYVTDDGTIIIRGGYGRSSLWIGLSPGANPEDDPDVVMKVGPALQRRIAAAILEIGNDITDDGFHTDDEINEGLIK